MPPRLRRRAANRPPSPPGFGAIWTTVALDLVGFGIVLPILPLYARRFHASPALIGLLVASFSVAQLLCAPLWGRLSDRVGRKPVLIVSLVGTAVGSLLTGLAGGLVLLFVGRVVDGVSGASVSVAQASVADVAAPPDRSRLFGLLGAAFGVGFVMGPAIGGVLSLLGPRVPFFVAAAIAGANALVASRRLPETHPRRVPGRVEVAVHGGTGSPADLVRPPVSGTVGRGSDAKRPVLTSGLLGLLLVAFLSMSAFSAFEATFALFGARRLALTQSSTYVVFTIIGLLIAFDQIALVHPVVKRFGERTALRAGLVLNAAGLVVLSRVHSLVSLAPALVLLTAGQGLITPTLSSAVVGQAPPRERGRVLGINQSVGGFGRVVGPAVAGPVFGHIGTSVPYLGGAVVLALAVMVLAIVPPLARR